MMRVLGFTTVFPNALRPQHGLFVQERLRHCAQHAEIRVVAPRPIWPWPAMRGVPRREVIGGLAVEHPLFRYLPRYGKWLDGFFLYASALPTVRQLRREFDFDLIDAHFGYPDGFAAALLGRSFQRPVVITLRGTEPLIARDPWRRRALGWALRNADRLIAVAQPLAEGAEALMREDARPGQRLPPVEVIANGVDAGRFVPAPQQEARHLLGLPEQGRLIVSVGHLSPRKGFQRVLRVLPELLGGVAPEARFAIVGGQGGEANNEAELRRLAAELGVAGRVIFAGAQPPERVAHWLNAADLFVLASDHEGCPNVVWEALACGLPVVATRVGEIERMVPDFAGRLFAEAEDAPALAAALAEGLTHDFDRAAIRAWAERHTWDAVAERVARQWSAALAPAPAQPRTAHATGETAA